MKNDTNKDLMFEILDFLRLNHIYILMGSPYENELGSDFKPHKWEGTELETAQKSIDLYRKFLSVMLESMGEFENYIHSIQDK